MSICSICLENLGLQNVCTLGCNHSYHLNCIINLYNMRQEYNNKCPECREVYFEEPPRSDFNEEYRVYQLDDHATETILNIIEQSMSPISQENDLNDFSYHYENLVEPWYKKIIVNKYVNLVSVGILGCSLIYKLYRYKTHNIINY